MHSTNKRSFDKKDFVHCGIFVVMGATWNTKRVHFIIGNYVETFDQVFHHKQLSKKTFMM